MISAHFLGQISERISRARGHAGDPDKPFGGVSVIYFGDLGQLPPVGSLSLFRHEFQNGLAPRIKEKHGGQSEAEGRLNAFWIWDHKLCLSHSRRRRCADWLGTRILTSICKVRTVNWRSR